MRVLETRKKKVTSIGTVSLGTKYAGSTIYIQDNEDSTLTIFIGDFNAKPATTTNGAKKGKQDYFELF